MQIGPTTAWPSTALRILCREISAPDTGRTGTSGVRELAAPDEIAEMIDGVTGKVCGFGETDRLVSYVLERTFKLCSRQLPKPGGVTVSELVEICGAFAPRCDESCTAHRPTPNDKRPQGQWRSAPDCSRCASIPAAFGPHGDAGPAASVVVERAYNMYRTLLLAKPPGRENSW